MQCLVVFGLRAFSQACNQYRVDSIQLLPAALASCADCYLLLFAQFHIFELCYFGAIFLCVQETQLK
jgi:hypothetical protein